jgi:hypothetical protein
MIAADGRFALGGVRSRDPAALAKWISGMTRRGAFDLSGGPASLLPSSGPRSCCGAAVADHDMGDGHFELTA